MTFIQGLILGFLIAMPVGPIGVLCIERSATHGRKAGLATGLGAATADGLYGAVAAFGLTAVSGFLVSVEAPLRIFGGLFLLYLGVRVLMRKETDKVSAKEGNWRTYYFSTVLLTLANPMTILFFAAIFAGTGFVAGARWFEASLMTIGVFLGSAAWWFFLSATVSYLRRRTALLSPRFIDRVSGSVICIFALVILLGVGK